MCKVQKREKIMELTERLSAIQRELKAPKGQFNAFGKYKYRNCEDILEALKPLLDGVPLTISDELVMIGDRYYVKATVCFGRAGNGGIITTAYAREELDKKGMDSSQITGAASSYARKYALNGLFLIDDTKDADATNTHGKEEKAADKKDTSAKTSALPPTPASQVNPDDIPEPENLSTGMENKEEKKEPPKPSGRAQWTIIAKLAGEIGWTKDQIAPECSKSINRVIATASELTFDEAQTVVKSFTDKRDKASKGEAA
jgi:hypothetical protein